MRSRSPRIRASTAMACWSQETGVDPLGVQQVHRARLGPAAGNLAASDNWSGAHTEEPDHQAQNQIPTTS